MYTHIKKLLNLYYLRLKLRVYIERRMMQFKYFFSVKTPK